MDFCLLLKTWGKILVENISKNLSSKYSQKLLDHAKQSAEATGDLKLIKLLIELRKSQKHYDKIIQKQLQMSMIKNYLNKDTYLQKKDRKLLII